MLDFELFIKYFSGKASFEEAMLIEDFAKSSPDKYAYLQSIHKSWIEAGNEHYQLPDVKKEWENFNAKYKLVDAMDAKPKGRIFSKKIALVATIIGLLGLSGYFLLNILNKPAKILRITALQEKSLTLIDSSIVTLHRGSTLIYPELFQKEKREIKLEGNADFEIKHQESQPFIIHLPNNLNIRVTGTSFSVVQTMEEVKVMLKKGSVLFYSKSDSIHILAKQTAKYLLTEERFLMESSFPDSGSFDFNNQTLNEIISNLNLYFHTEIQFRNPEIGKCRFSGSFKNQKLSEIINIIASTFNFDYELNGSKIWINGEACD